MYGKSLALENMFNSSMMFLDGAQPRWKEDGEKYCLKVPVPGLSSEDLSIYVEDRNLVIKFKNESETNEDDNLFRFFSAKQWQWALPRDSNIEEINSSLSRGVLQVNIPKSEVFTKRIEIVEDNNKADNKADNKTIESVTTE